MERRERKTYLDTLRILAAFFVIYNHVAGQNMRLLSGVGGAAALFALYLSKSAIPIFLLVSGATLLKTAEPYGKCAKRVGRMALALALFSLFYYGVQCLDAGAPFVLGEFLDTLYHSQVSYSFWYLYAYIGLLVMLPILSRMTAAFGENEYRYFAFWTLLFSGGMPILTAVSPLFVYDNAFELVVFCGMIGMPVLGRYIDAYIRFSPRNTALAIALPIAVTAASVAATWYNPTLFALLDNGLLLPAMVCACCIAYLVKLVDAKCAPSERVRAGVSYIAKRTFCTYLISDFLIVRLQFVREALVPILKTNGAGAAYTLLIFLVGLGVSAILTRIPGLKKIL